MGLNDRERSVAISTDASDGLCESSIWCGIHSLLFVQ